MTGFTDEQLLAEYAFMRRFARALTMNSTEADDLAHDCVVHALERRNQYQSSGTLRGWLGLMLMNLFRDRFRKRKRHALGLERLSILMADHQQQSNQESAFVLKRLRRALGILPEAQREAFELVALLGCTTEHAAVTLGIPEGTVKSRVSRSRYALRRKIGYEGTAL